MMDTFSVAFYDTFHLFLYLAFAHLIGDFLLQPQKLLAWKKRAKKGILVHVSIHFAVTCLLLIPYMLTAGISGFYTLFGILAIVVIHFFIDMEKIRLENLHPKKSFLLYVLDQAAHISVIAIFTLVLSMVAYARFESTLFGEIYFDKWLVSYVILLVISTYTWEITKYEKKRNDNKKLPPFSPDLKGMAVRGIIVSAVFILLMPFDAYAVNPQFAEPGKRTAHVLDVNPNQFSFGDTVMITGNGFGDEMSQYSQVCWGQLCVNKDSITKWTDTEIQFKMNVLGMPSQGQLHVVRLNESGLYTEDASGENVTVLPTIDKLFDDKGNQIFSLTAGQTVRVTGYYFGDTTGMIKLDTTYVGQIQPWTTGEITFIVPELAEQTSTLTIQRRNGSQVTLDITSHTGLSNDEFSHLQTYLFNANVEKAWGAYPARGEGVTVAVLDDGMDITHPDLKSAVWVNADEVAGDNRDNDGNGYIDDVNGYNFRDKNANMSPKGEHGTLVAGVIAAKANNEIGIAGIAPNVKIMPLTVCGLDNCSGQAVYDAVKYAVDNGADIINLSLTGFGDDPIFDPAYNQIMQYAHDRGVFIVVAAGNGDLEMAKAQTYYGRNFNVKPISPVCNDGQGDWVIGVASINSSLSNSVFSDYGNDCINISAFGEAVYSTSAVEFSADGKTYAYAYGTSFATPQVSGALALAISAFPKKSMKEFVSALYSSGFDLEPHLALEWRGQFGRGLDVYGYLNALNGSLVEGQTNTGTEDENNDVVDDSVSVIDNGGVNTDAPSTFSDISETDSSYVAINYLAEESILKGYADGTFKPDLDVNRAELLKMLIASQGIEPDKNRYRNCFTDVKEEWFAPYVCYGKRQGWVEGYKDGSFRPWQTVNKVEALKMMIESYDLAFGMYETAFVDVKAGDWFYEYVALAEHMGLLTERGALFNPSRARSRAAIAVSIFRILAVKGIEAEVYTDSVGEEFVSQ